MKETDFIEKNKHKWEELEGLLKGKKKDPDLLSRLFIQVTDDLSFSRTYYKNRSIRVYLNDIARKIFNSLHKKSFSGVKEKFVSFCKVDLPIILYQSRKDLLVSFLVFTAAVLVGVFSTIYSPDFTASILGEGYVAMTKANIASGDPMAVYKGRGATDMFSSIAFNNLRVAALTFASGGLLLIGTLYVLVYNGIMVGTFQYFFVQEGLFKESALTIWMHGTLEISAIIIAGAAGITLGKGIVFPGTLPRIYSIQKSAKRGVKIMLGISPIIVLAALIEGFITRLTEAPDILRLFFILLCLAYVIFYFVIYPIRVARSNPEKLKKDEKLIKLPQSKVNISTDIPKKPPVILSETIQGLKVYFKPILFFTLLLSVFQAFSSTYIVTYGFGSDWSMFYYDDINGFLSTLLDFASYPMLIIPNFLVLVLIISFWFYLFKRLCDPKSEETTFKLSESISVFKKNLFSIVIGALVVCSAFFLPISFAIVVFFLSIAAFVYHLLNSQNKNIKNSLSYSIRLVFYQFSSYAIVTFFVGVVLILAYSFCNGLLGQFLIQPIRASIWVSEAYEAFLDIGILFFIYSVLVNFSLFFLLIAYGINYYSLQEIESANGLRKKVNSIGYH